MLQQWGITVQEWTAIFEADRQYLTKVLSTLTPISLATTLVVRLTFHVVIRAVHEKRSVSSGMINFDQNIWDEVEVRFFESREFSLMLTCIHRLPTGIRITSSC
jgi:hypothetical protein